MTTKKAPTARASTNKQSLSKKDQIQALFTGGITDVNDLAVITHSRPSYVAGVLQDNKLMSGYFDLYTNSSNPMNIYSKFFAGKLGFKDKDTAHESVDWIDHMYRQFETAEDRAGQHHCLLMALTMFDRARWTGKGPEADIFSRWLMGKLEEFTPTPGDEVAAAGHPLAR
jgi:hypothetical protein